jgi:thiol-disulfide isomerase/thioredoxin
MKYLSVILISAVFFSCSERDTSYKTGLEGKPMPEFSILLSDSSTYLNSKKFSKGQPIVLFCFGPHCPFSRAQMDELISNISSMKDMKVYAITPWPFSEMKSFKEDYSLSKYPNIVIGYDSANFLGSYFKMKGVPFTVVYDKDKKLKGSFLGKTSSDEIRKVVKG